MSEVENRLGLQPLEELHAERDILVRRVADLRARHGAFGTWPDIRRVQLATIAQLIRAQALRDGVKLTGAEVDDAAHADSRYIELVKQATKDRAELTILEHQIQNIEETVMRQQAIARFLANEVRLDR